MGNFDGNGSNGQSANYYILLGLSFDPPVEDESEIHKAINAKQAEWSRKSSQPIIGKKYAKYLDQLDQITVVMMDPAERRMQADQAREIKRKKAKELQEKLGLYDELDDKAVEKLHKVYGDFGFSGNDIRRLYKTIKSGKKEKIDRSQILDSTKAKLISKAFKDLGQPGQTLYTLLGLSARSSDQDLYAKADEGYKQQMMRGDQTSPDVEPKKRLYNLAKDIFNPKKPEIRQQYDNFINITRYTRINDAVDEAANINKRQITPEQKDRILNIALEAYQSDGLKVSDASVYITNYCEYMGYTLPDNKIICGLCQTENPSGATNCLKCGRPLKIVCPSCQSENTNSAKICAKCGFDLSHMDKAIELIRGAKTAFAAKDFAGMQRLLGEAKAYWPGHPDIAALDQQLKDVKERASAVIGEIMEAIRCKRLYEAKTKIDQAIAAGVTLDQGVVDQVSQSLAKAQSLISDMRVESGDQAFMKALDASKIIADAPELNEAIKRFPPKPAGIPSLEQHGDRVALRWAKSPSTGDVDYVVVRREGAFPNSLDDGSPIYSGRETMFTDSGLSHGHSYGYAVFARRLGVVSVASRAASMVSFVAGVAGLKCIGGDGSVTLSWKAPAGVTEVRVGMCQSDTQPTTDGAYSPIPSGRLDGDTIQGLSNGDGYWFSVRTVMVLDGTIRQSDPVYISTIPQKPAEPLQDFTVQYEDGVFCASWTQSSWDVVLFASEEKPEYASGVIYDMGDVLSRFPKIDMTLTSRITAEFTLNFVGDCYIIPGVVNASNVIFNDAVYLSSVPDVSRISSDLNSGATEMYVNFDWPRGGVSNSLLAYRLDGEYPQGPDDPLARHVESNRRQYDNNAGIVITDPPEGTYHAVIYTYVDKANRRIYSSGVKTVMSNEPQRTIRYSLKYKRPGLFSRKSVLTVSLNPEMSCVLPAFVIVGKSRSLPLKRGDGEMLCSVPGSVELERGGRSFEFDVPPLPAGMRLKMFFVNDRHYREFKLVCTGGGSI